MPDPDSSPLDRLGRWLRTLRPARSSGDTIAGQVGEGARGVVIGKNVIQIERFLFPLWLFPLFLLGALAVAALLWLRYVPAQMPDNTFNVAVATFGEVGPDGRIRPSERGEWFSQRTYEVLADFNRESGAGGQVTLWHDSRGWTEKRSRIGRVTAESAAALTKRINADVLVYGHLTADGELALNFYADPKLQSLTDSIIIGRYEFGDPIPFRPNFDPRADERAEGYATSLLRPRVISLAWLLRGFIPYSVGDVEPALEIWQQAANDRPRLGGRSEGEEVLHLLIGVAYLTPDIRGEIITNEPENVAEAEKAFRRALDSPSLSIKARARIGLGNVHFARAQQHFPDPRVTPSPDEVQQAQQDLQRAIDEYEFALDLIQQLPDDPLLKALATIVPTPAYRLLGQTYLYPASWNDVLAEQFLNDTITGVETNLPLLIEAQEHRLVAVGYDVLGTALAQKAWLAGEQDHLQTSRTLYQQAAAAFDDCIAQKSLDDDTFLDSTAALCAAHAEVAARLDQAQGGEE